MTESSRDGIAADEQFPEGDAAPQPAPPMDDAEDEAGPALGPQPASGFEQPPRGEEAGEPPPTRAALAPDAAGTAVRTPATKTWYPYITKTQFDKFLARLENRMPPEIDRDYVRAIIHTPSMIYRFLRGIEAMGLIDRDQRPTERLHRLVDRESRSYALAEILQDLYGDLLADWQRSGEALGDDDIVDYFRVRTGMGRDSANKMKMFFKYMLSEATFGQRPTPTPASGERAAPAEMPKSPPASDQHAAPPPKEAAAGAPAVPPPAPPPPEREPQAAPRPREPLAEARASQQQPQPRHELAPQRAAGRDIAVQDRRRGRDGRDGGREQRAPAEQRVPAPRDGAQPAAAAPAPAAAAEPAPPPQEPRGFSGPQTLTDVQRAYLQTLQAIVRVNVDGDWDEEMIRTVFDRLERLFDRIRRS